MIFFFYGPNAYATRHEIHRMTEAYIKKTGSDLGFERLEGPNLSLKTLQATLQASPFLATSRLVIVDDFGKVKVTGEALERVLASIPSTTVVIFCDSEVDQRTAYYKTMHKVARNVKFEALTGAQLNAWVSNEAKQLGGSIDRAGVQALLATAGENQWRLSGEISKLVSYQSKITAETVALLVVPTLNQSIFDLVEAMTAGRGKAALGAYHELLAERTNEIYLLTMVIWQLRNLLLARTAHGLAPNDLAKVAGMSPYVATKAMQAARSYDESTLKQAFLAATECEYRIKSGIEPAQPAVERLILEVATKR
jgi:DNA polymerase-3 subunit delta